MIILVKSLYLKAVMALKARNHIKVVKIVIQAVFKHLEENLRWRRFPTIPLMKNHLQTISKCQNQKLQCFQRYVVQVQLTAWHMSNKAKLAA